MGLKSAASLTTFVIFLILLGASFGGVLVVYPPLTFKTFGVKNFGINYGIIFLDILSEHCCCFSCIFLPVIYFMHYRGKHKHIK